uniref:Uncharacterized protein n=1 Tax=Anguilla anguilla TaxID=7936 RepID=A0A0E9R9J0_ANGAN
MASGELLFFSPPSGTHPGKRLKKLVRMCAVLGRGGNLQLDFQKALPQLYINQ